MSNNSATNPSDVTAILVRALVLYALAEFQSGNASTLRVSAEGCSFSVSDDGRGHAIDRNVAGKAYLPFIYTHLEYPFAAGESSPVQLHGIGMSVLNALCSELSVVVQKKTVTLFLNYRGGYLYEDLRTDNGNEATGTAVSGKVSSHIQRAETNVIGIEHWLTGILGANPGLKLYFNEKELHALHAGAA